MDENQDLWRQIKAAKDHLFTQTGFLQQYSPTHAPYATAPLPVSMTTGETSAPFTTRADTSLVNFPDNINTGPLQETPVSINTQGKHDTSIWKEQGFVILDAPKRFERELAERRRRVSSKGCSSLKDSELLPSLSTAVPVALPLSSASPFSRENQGVPLATSDTLSSKCKQIAAFQGT